MPKDQEVAHVEAIRIDVRDAYLVSPWEGDEDEIYPSAVFDAIFDEHVPHEGAALDLIADMRDRGLSLSLAIKDDVEASTKNWRCLRDIARDITIAHLTRGFEKDEAVQTLIEHRRARFNEHFQPSSD